MTARTLPSLCTGGLLRWAPLPRPLLGDDVAGVEGGMTPASATTSPLEAAEMTVRPSALTTTGAYCEPVR